MALTGTYLQAISRIPDLFTKIRDAQAPDHLSQLLLKDWGFSSSNDRAFIPFLKALGFLSPDGQPTQRYHDYRDHSRSKDVMAEALRDAYGDIFLIKSHPTNGDRAAIEGKFKSYHNASDNVAQLMTKTFLALLNLADLNSAGKPSLKIDKTEDKEDKPPATPPKGEKHSVHTGLHYNIQIHLPATKDIEVYNAIFKSLKEHVIG